MRVVSIRGCPRKLLLRELRQGDVFEFILDPVLSPPGIYMKLCPDVHEQVRFCALGSDAGSSWSGRDLDERAVRKVPAHLVVGED